MLINDNCGSLNFAIAFRMVPRHSTHQGPWDCCSHHVEELHLGAGCEIMAATCVAHRSVAGRCAKTAGTVVCHGLRGFVRAILNRSEEISPMDIRDALPCATPWHYIKCLQSIWPMDLHLGGNNSTTSLYWL